MDLLINDLSVHEQFHNPSALQAALAELVAIRRTARKYGQEVFCGQRLLMAKPMPGIAMQQAVGRLAEPQKRAVMSWFTRGGPFWDDLRRHGGDDWLECKGEIVTDTAVGEAAYKAFHGVASGLLSFSPSDWCYAPVKVAWRRDGQGAVVTETALDNWWDSDEFGAAMHDSPSPIDSWGALRKAAIVRHDCLKFADDCFSPLGGVPFAKAAADRFLFLCDILNRLASETGAQGNLSTAGQRIYQDHFTGGTALFSDSSDTEKSRFQKELSFDHPGRAGAKLFCPWHGKVRRMNLRLHFSWPVRSGQDNWVVYAGPKITKR